MNLVITISGFPGCGKTTVAKRVAGLLDARYISTGEIQRSIAAERGLNTLQMNAVAESDPTIDADIDCRTLKIVRSEGKIVVDSRLAWRLLPRSLKVFITCPVIVAANRVHAAMRSDEPYDSVQHTVESLTQRFELERNRFRRKYDAHLDELRNFDIVLDSSVLSAKEIADEIVKFAADASVGATGTLVVLSPRQIYPTADIRTVTQDALLHARGSRTVLDWRESEIPPIKVVRINEYWFALGNHPLLGVLLDVNRTSAVCVPVARDDEIVGHRQTARRLVMDRSSASVCFDWESAFGFEYAVSPDQVFGGIDRGVSGLV